MDANKITGYFRAYGVLTLKTFDSLDPTDDPADQTSKVRIP